MNRRIEPEENAAPVERRQAVSLRADNTGQAADGFPWWRLMSAIAIGIVLGVGTLAFFQLLAYPLVLFFLGIAISASLAPLVGRLDKRLPRSLAVILIYIILVLIFAGLLWVVIPPLVGQARDAAQRLPSLIQNLQPLLQRWGPINVDSLIDTVIGQLGGVTSTLVQLPLRLTTSLVEFFIVLFVSLYALTEAPRVKRFFLSLFPEDSRDRANEVVSRMGEAMGGWIRGSVIDGFIVGLITYIGLLIIGVEFPLVLGLLSGVLELIPYLGPIIAGGLIILVALLESPGLALTALIFVVILQQIESNILVPNIMKTQTEVSPLMALVAIFAGGSLGGLVGAIVAIPLMAALRVLVLKVVVPFVRRRSGAAQDVEESRKPAEELVDESEVKS